MSGRVEHVQTQLSPADCLVCDGRGRLRVRGLGPNGYREDQNKGNAHQLSIIELVKAAVV